MPSTYGRIRDGLVLAPVPHPTTSRVSSHVTPILRLPVAVHGAHTVASIPLVHLGDAVVSVPAAFRVHPSVAVDFCAVAILGVSIKAGTTGVVAAARTSSGRA